MARTTFKISFLVLSFFKVCNGQGLFDIARHFCLELFGVDNFSCLEEPAPGSACFPLDFLCNGVNDCIDGADEGNTLVSSSLCCDPLFISGENTYTGFWGMLMFFSVCSITHNNCIRVPMQGTHTLLCMCVEAGYTTVITGLIVLEHVRK